MVRYRKMSLSIPFLRWFRVLLAVGLLLLLLATEGELRATTPFESWLSSHGLDYSLPLEADTDGVGFPLLLEYDPGWTDPAGWTWCSIFTSKRFRWAITVRPQPYGDLPFKFFKNNSIDL